MGDGTPPSGVEVTIQDHVPYEESILWRVHDAYYEKRGPQAWTENEVPSFATSNEAIARQHARLVLELVAQLEEEGALAPGEPVSILEVACGAGEFAANFLRALGKETGEAGAALFARVRYVLTDFSRRTVDAAAATRGLAPLVKHGVVIPAQLDLANPSRIVGLHGKRTRFAVVFANDLCCAVRHRLIRQAGGKLLEGHVRVGVKLPDGVPPTQEAATACALDGALRKDHVKQLVLGFDGRAGDPALVCGGEAHAAAVARVLEPLEEASFAYPRTFLDFLVAVRSRLVAGGVVLVNDYGVARVSELAGLGDPKPIFYGNSVSHPVPYPVIHAFLELAGLDARRARDPFAATYTLAIRHGAELGPRLARAFRRSCVRRAASEELIDLSCAARALYTSRDLRSAPRLYRRCIELAPGSADLHYRLGVTCAEAGWHSLALKYPKRGRELDPEGTFDVTLFLGKAYFGLGRHRSAVRQFRRSLAREKTVSGFVNLGYALEKLEDYEGAYLGYRRAMLKVIEQYLPKGWAASVAKE